MPLRHKSAQKRARQTKKRTERNKTYKVLIKSGIKRTLESKDKATGASELKKTSQVIDRAAAKRVIHKNKAANIKSKLARKVNKLT